MQTSRLHGKQALVLGGTSGIGQAVAECYVQEGAKVHLTGRHPDRTNATVERIGRGVEGHVVDITRIEDLLNLQARLRDAAFRIDSLFVSAGVAAGAPLGAITEDHLDHLLDTNVKGLVMAVQALLPLMNDGGSITLVGSTGTARGTAGLSIYNASKAAVRSLARSWMLELAPRRIRVNVVSPGPTTTPLLEALAPPRQAGRMYDALRRGVPAGRIGTPLDIAHCAVFLASDESVWVNGSEFAVDGGMAQF